VVRPQESNGLSSDSAPRDSAGLSSVAFVTSAWQRDWTVVLDPKRYGMVLESQRHDFPIRLVVLNNFKDASTAAAALRAAELLKESGLATDVLVARDYLTDDVLRYFDFDPESFWRLNPWFSTAHIAALHYLRGKTEWILYFSGDVRLERACNWLPRAFSALQQLPRVRGFNLCRNIYQSIYPLRCDEETTDFWIGFSDDAAKPCGPLHGLDLSDHAYFIPVDPVGGWKFGIPEELMKKFYRHFPVYARPCFELYYWAAMYRFDFGHGALKPINGIPLTKHKNFPNNWKIHLYKALGYYGRNRRHGTRFD
jgi:hypothetical protein